MKRPVLIAVLGAVVVVAALVLAFVTLEGGSWLSPPPPPVEPPPLAARTPAPPPKPAEPVHPSFDVVRIDNTGNAVMAGKAAPNSAVSIMDGGQVVGEVKADGRGEWVYLPDKPLPAGSRELSLHAVTPDGTTLESKDSVVLVVPEHPGDKTLALRTDREGKAGSDLLQGAAPLPSSEAPAIDTVDYDEQGKIVASGRSKPGITIQLYLDNTFLGRTTAGEDGRWRLSPETPASPGSHVLRADATDAEGKVSGREEIPFSRVEVSGMPEGVRVVVQPGNNLWLLARHAYGRGHAYTVIYDANKGQIRNPDLIYPGQIFVVPKEKAAEAERLRQKKASAEKPHPDDTSHPAKSSPDKTPPQKASPENTPADRKQEHPRG